VSGRVWVCGWLFGGGDGASLSIALYDLFSRSSTCTYGRTLLLLLLLLQHWLSISSSNNGNVNNEVWVLLNVHIWPSLQR